MKVLYLIPGLGAGGGAEKSLLAITPALRAAGIDLTIAHFVTTPTDNAAAYEAAGAKVVKVAATSFAARVRAVRRLLQSEAPDVLHTTLYDADQVGRLAAVGLPVRVIASYTNSNFDVARQQDPTYRAWRVEVTRLLAGATARHLTVGGHAVSDAARQASARAFGLRVDEVAVVHRGRDLAQFRGIDPARVSGLRSELGLAADAQVIVSIGRQEYQKDHLTLLAALARLRRTHPRAVVVVAGRVGSMTTALEARIAELGLTDAVHLLGHRGDVADLLALADVVPFTSILEGFSGVLLEVVAAGRPLVASAIPPNRELLAGTDVPLVAPGDADGFAAAIADALDHPEAAAARTADALAHVRAWISVEHAADGMVSLYRSLAEPGSRVVADDAGRGGRHLYVVPDLAAGGRRVDEVIAECRRRLDVGEVPIVATWSVGDRHRSVALEDQGITVHELAGRSAVGRAAARRRLAQALRPVTVHR